MSWQAGDLAKRGRSGDNEKVPAEATGQQFASWDSAPEARLHKGWICWHLQRQPGFLGLQAKVDSQLAVKRHDGSVADPCGRRFAKAKAAANQSGRLRSAPLLG